MDAVGVGKQNLVAPSARERSYCAYEGGERQDVLQEAGDRRKELPACEYPKLTSVGRARGCMLSRPDRTGHNNDAEHAGLFAKY
jgi:hypothetical protein